MKAKKVLSGICAVVMFSTCAIVATGCSSSESAKESHVEQLQQGGMVIAGNKVHGISMLSTIIPAEDYEEYGIALAAESAQMITLDVSPSNATIKDIVWDLSWYDPSNSWIGSKLVGDYVTIQQQQDLISVYVTCLQDFGAAIKLTCTLTDGYGNEWTDSAMINYVIKPTGIKSVSIGKSSPEVGVSVAMFRAGSSYSADATLDITMDSDKDYTIGIDHYYDVSQFGICFQATTVQILLNKGFTLFKQPNPDDALYVANSDVRYSGNFYLNALSEASLAAVLNGTKQAAFYEAISTIAAYIEDGSAERDYIFVDAEFENEENTYQFSADYEIDIVIEDFRV